MDSTLEVPADPSFYTPDVFIYSPYNPPDQPALLTKQMPKKLIADEYIDLSFLHSIAPIPLTPDMGVLKYLIQEGEELLPYQDLPKPGAVLRIKYEGRKLDGQLLDRFRDKNEVRKFKLGKDGYIEGINIALSTMKRKEVAWFRFEPLYHYYGGNMTEVRATCDGECMVRNDEALFYKMEIVDYVNHEKLENDDFDGRVKKLEEIRLKAKEIFQKGEFSAALKIYTKGLGIAKSFPRSLMESLDSSQQSTFRFYHGIMHSNTILCKMRQKKWYEAIRLCDDGLEVSSFNTKLLFLKGRCNLHISQYDIARDCFSGVLAVEPDNLEAKEMIEKARKQENDEKINEKARFKKVFENLENEEKAEDKENKAKMKKRKMEDRLSEIRSNSEAVEIENEDDDEEEDFDDLLPFDSLAKGMVIDTNDPNNMFNQIKCMEIEEKM